MRCYSFTTCKSCAASDKVSKTICGIPSYCISYLFLSSVPNKQTSVASVRRSEAVVVNKLLYVLKYLLRNPNDSILFTFFCSYVNPALIVFYVLNINSC